MLQIRLESYWLTNFWVEQSRLVLWHCSLVRNGISPWISLSSLGRPGLSPNIAASIFAVTISSFLFEYFLVLNFRFVTGVSSKSSKHWITKCNESYVSFSIGSESLGESDMVDGLESGSKLKLEPSESFATFLQVSQILEPIWTKGCFSHICLVTGLKVFLLAVCPLILKGLQQVLLHWEWD